MDEYQFQFQQVTQALKKDPGNPQLKKLHLDLETLIELLQREKEEEEEELQKSGGGGGMAESNNWKNSKKHQQQQPSHVFLEGDMALGRWSDGSYYECMVIGQAGSDSSSNDNPNHIISYEVVFTGFESVQILPGTSLRVPRQGEKMQTLLSSRELQVGELSASFTSKNKYHHAPGSTNSSSSLAAGALAAAATTTSGSSSHHPKKFPGGGGGANVKGSKVSKRDLKDKEKVNAWQTFSGNKRVLKKGRIGVVGSSSSSLISGHAAKSKQLTALPGKSKNQFNVEDHGDREEGGSY